MPSKGAALLPSSSKLSCIFTDSDTLFDGLYRQFCTAAMALPSKTPPAVDYMTLTSAVVPSASTVKFS